MAFQLSPGVVVKEQDFTSIVPNVATSSGAFAGNFQWGPIEDPVQIVSENNLVERFGGPTDATFDSFFTAANFLSYSNNLLTVRADTTAARNAVATGTAVKIKNLNDYTSNYVGGSNNVGTVAAKWAGSRGNSIKVEIADSATFAAWSNKGKFDRIPGTSASVAAAGGSDDELHVLVIDEDGLFTGTAGATLETFAHVSAASDSKKFDGSNNFYKDVINSQSRFIWWMDHPTVTGTAWGAASSGTTYGDLAAVYAVSLTGGIDTAPTAGNVQTALSIFANDELYDISLVMVGKADAATATFAINNIAEVRKDCMVFCSAEDASGNTILATDADPVGDITTYRNSLPSSSYGVLDTGSKYQYDRYNDKYRYVPLNGDIAGLAARTDYDQDAWFSPAGASRGQIKNVVKLAFSPNKTQRDTLYQSGVNPVVTFPGNGTQLFGDKTLLSSESAFNRINVRRLFIVLEKAIAIAAKAQLFEFNDEFTRNDFKNAVNPFLRDVQGRRGITDFSVVCDGTNNTGDVVDRNEFRADIFIKPNRAINFITLTFVASKSSVDFSEIGG